MKKLLLLAAAAVCTVVLTGCFGSGTFTSFTYDHPERYSIGPGQVTQPVKHLDIQWVAGPVKLRYGTGEEVSFTEKANETLSKSTAMHWWLDGDTLRLRFCESGRVQLGHLEKTLTVTLPAGVILEDVEISSVSGAIDAPQLHAGEVELATTSGGVDACIYGAESVRAATVSGTVRLETPGELEELSAATTSGTIDLTAERVEELSVGTVSGAVTVTARQADRGDIGTTSGSVDVTLSNADGRWEIGTVSGSVDLTIPEDADVTVEYSTTSGSFRTAIPMRQEGKKTFTAGRGGEEWKIHTTSGSLEIHSGT